MRAGFVSPELSRKRSDAGRIGGLQTILRHGREHLVAAGRLGGRPRAVMLQPKDVTEIDGEPENKGMGGMDAPRSTLSLAALRKLYRQRSNCRRR